MCFNKYGDELSHYVAEADIECFKVLFHSRVSNGYYSPYQLHKYDFGELYKHDLSDLDVVVMDMSHAIYGNVFHSYINFQDALKELNKVVCHAILRGIVNTPHIVRCVIPKGTIYWKNSTQFASVSIKAVGVVTAEECGLGTLNSMPLTKPKKS